MINTWEREHPGRIDTIFNAIKHVSPSQLADTDLFDFKGLSLERETDQNEKITIPSLSL
jgi:tRNA 2-thiocytidine biosynthesis protein TtcA